MLIGVCIKLVQGAIKYKESSRISVVVYRSIFFLNTKCLIKPIMWPENDTTIYSQNYNTAVTHFCTKLPLL